MEQTFEQTKPTNQDEFTVTAAQATARLGCHFTTFYACAQRYKMQFVLRSAGTACGRTINMRHYRETDVVVLQDLLVADPKTGVKRGKKAKPVKAKPVKAKPVKAKPVKAKPVKAKPDAQAPVDLFTVTVAEACQLLDCPDSTFRKRARLAGLQPLRKAKPDGDTGAQHVIHYRRDDVLALRDKVAADAARQYPGKAKRNSSVTIASAGRHLRVSHDQVYRLVAAGRLVKNAPGRVTMDSVRSVLASGDTSVSAAVARTAAPLVPAVVPPVKPVAPARALEAVKDTRGAVMPADQAMGAVAGFVAAMEAAKAHAPAGMRPTLEVQITAGTVVATITCKA